MGITGPAPKEDALRRNKATFDKVIVVADGVIRGPELPEDVEWHPRTIEWYAMWRASAQATIMEDSDWEMLLETAFLHTRFWFGKMSAAQHVALAGELRRRVAALGSTFEDRLKLRMVIQGDSPSTEDETIEAAAADGVNYLEKVLARTAELAQEAKLKEE